MIYGFHKAEQDYLYGGGCQMEKESSHTYLYDALSERLSQLIEDEFTAEEREFMRENGLI